VTLYLSPGKSLNGATQLLATTRTLKLKKGASKSLKLKLPSYPSLFSGTYFLIVAVKAPDGTTTGVAGSSLAISPAPGLRRRLRA